MVADPMGKRFRRESHENDGPYFLFSVDRPGGYKDRRAQEIQVAGVTRLLKQLVAVGGCVSALMNGLCNIFCMCPDICCCPCRI